MTAPLRDVFAWMVSTISGDAELDSLGVTGVFAYKAPEDQTLPYVILEKQSGVHSFNFGLESYNRSWIAAKVISGGPGGSDLGHRIQDRIRELFNLQRPTLTEGSVMIIKAVNDFEYVEAESGNLMFFYAGTSYLVQLTG